MLTGSPAGKDDETGQDGGHAVHRVAQYQLGGIQPSGGETGSGQGQTWVEPCCTVMEQGLHWAG